MRHTTPAHPPCPVASAPGGSRWSQTLDALPAGLWLALLAVTLWPVWRWMGDRALDRSDDPLGLLALTALGALAARHRHQLRTAPRLGWFALALVGAVACTAAQGVLPALGVALLGLLAMAAALAAFLPAAVASAPLLGLSVLALPLLASLQFYAGFPLRVVTAEVSSWLLHAAGYTVERLGASLQINGQLVIVDAPCSGVQMAWLGYFSACAATLYLGRGNRAFLTRLPAVSVLVLGGNIVRNSILVAAQASGALLPEAVHEGIGLIVLAAVCSAIAWVMSRPEEDRHV